MSFLSTNCPAAWHVCAYLESAKQPGGAAARGYGGLPGMAGHGQFGHHAAVGADVADGVGARLAWVDGGQPGARRWQINSCGWSPEVKEGGAVLGREG